MATTPRGFRYPVAADTPDVPRDMHNLALDVDAMFVHDNMVNRPAFGKVGREFYAEDTGLTWLDIGAAWVLKGAYDLVRTGDSRLGDMRTPLNASVTDAKVASAAGIAPSKIAGTAVVTGDARLSDTRTPTDGTVTNAKVATAAAIAMSKLALAITNAEVAATAAIAPSKLRAVGCSAEGTAALVGPVTTTTLGGGETWDSDSIYNPATGLMSIPTGMAGTWVLHGWLQHINANANTSAEMAYRLNGGGPLTSIARVHSPIATGYPSGGSTAIMRLAVSDDVAVFVTNNDSVSRSIAWRIGLTYLGA